MANVALSVLTEHTSFRKILYKSFRIGRQSNTWISRCVMYMYKTDDGNEGCIQTGHVNFMQYTYKVSPTMSSFELVKVKDSHKLWV